MHDDRFDAVTRNLARGRSRRAVVAGLLGLGGVAASALVAGPVEAARRGFAGPLKPTPVDPSDNYCEAQFSCINGICCDPNAGICEGSGANCSSTVPCAASDEICFNGHQCWRACNLPG
jgi:hypothetical protein